MSKQLFTAFLLFGTLHAGAQNVGIGTTNPTAKLDVAGEVKLGNTNMAAPAPGTMRWNEVKKDFEGFNGTAWVSLTGGKSAWGSQRDFSYENSVLELTLSEQSRNGSAIAAQDDFMVIGAPLNKGIVPAYAGSARLLKKEGDNWVVKKFIQPSGINGYAYFGKSVAMHNKTFVIGASSMNVGANNGQGKVYVYSFTDETNFTTAELLASDGNEYDGFGSSTAIHNNRVIVGAPRNDIGSIEEQGAVYIFEKQGGNWQQMARLLHPNPQKYDVMGMSVAINGNYAVAGVPRKKIGSHYNQGIVHVYKFNGSAWVPMANITPPDTTGSNHFLGHCLQMATDTLLVGMPQYESGSVGGNGKVLIYTRSGNSWNLQSTLTASDGQWGDAFGTSLHLSGDQLIVGAPQANIGASLGQGKAYIFKKSGNTWIHEAVVTSSNGKDYDLFGTAVAMVPGCAIVGAPHVDNGIFEQMGQVYFFKK